MAQWGSTSVPYWEGPGLNPTDALGKALRLNLVTRLLAIFKPSKIKRSD